MARLCLLACAAVLLLLEPLPVLARNNPNCKVLVNRCTECFLKDRTRCRDCKPGYYPSPPKFNRCEKCAINGCADCKWSVDKREVQCTVPCADTNCRLCSKDGTICNECNKGYRVDNKGACAVVVGGVGFCGASDPMGDLYYARAEYPYSKWQFRNLPLGCWPCEEPSFKNCKDCGFCTPGTAGCTASRNYNMQGTYVLSRVDGFKCLTCSNGSPAINGKCT